MDAAELRTRFAAGEVDFRGIELPDADLQGIELPGVDFRGANLQGANLAGAIMPDGRVHDPNDQA